MSRNFPKNAILRFQMRFLPIEIHARHRPGRNNCVQSGLPALGELSIVYLDNGAIARREQCDPQAATSDRESRQFEAGFLCYPVSGLLTPIQTRRAQLARDASTLSVGSGLFRRKQTRLSLGDHARALHCRVRRNRLSRAPGSLATPQGWVFCSDCVEASGSGA
jgi:hypothetical protein